MITGGVDMEKKRGDTLRARAAKKLYAERVMKDLNQSDLAERVGTKKSNISRIESGKQNITVDYLEILADALDKDVVLELRDREVRYGSKNVYCLKIFDDELMRFSMERKDGDVSVSVISVNEDLKHLFPLDLDATEAGVLRWLRRRVIPGNRELVERILSALDVEPGDIKGIIDVCLGLSLNDCYWVVPEDLTGLFSEYNLYENEFNEALSLIAYAGYGRVPDRFVTTPELTTGGMLRKAWRNRGDDGIWLYKSGTSGFANAGNEPYSEYYACQVAEQMGLDAVHYELENWHHILASKCRLFTDIETSFVPIGSIVTEGGIDRVIDCYRELGDGFYQALASMLVFDAIVVNEDRHFGNFGLLRTTAQVRSSRLRPSSTTATPCFAGR